MRLIDADELKRELDAVKIVIDEDILKCNSIHDELVYLLKKVEDAVMEKISEQPTIEAVPLDGEYIKQIRWKRDIALRQLADIGCSLGRDMTDIKKKIEAAPVVHGEWIHGEFDENHHWVKGSKHVRCSECWRVFDSDSLNIWHWCPQCGAKMDRGDCSD